MRQMMKEVLRGYSWPNLHLPRQTTLGKLSPKGTCQEPWETADCIHPQLRLVPLTTTSNISTYSDAPFSSINQEVRPAGGNVDGQD